VPEGDDRAEAAFAEVYQAGGVQDRLLVDQGEVIADPADYVDAPIVFRQDCCPSCWTTLYSAVVPAGHTDTATSLGRLTATPGQPRSRTR
jgi:hypothetical protein